MKLAWPVEMSHWSAEVFRVTRVHGMMPALPIPRLLSTDRAPPWDTQPLSGVWRGAEAARGESHFPPLWGGPWRCAAPAPQSGGKCPRQLRLFSTSDENERPSPSHASASALVTHAERVTEPRGCFKILQQRIFCSSVSTQDGNTAGKRSLKEHNEAKQNHQQITKRNRWANRDKLVTVTARENVRP